MATETSERKLLGKRFIHCCKVHKPKDCNEAIVVKVHKVYSDGTVEPGLDIIRDPSRSFYITKDTVKPLYNEKKEWELIDNLDQYIVKNYELANEVHTRLIGYAPRNKYIRLNELSSSPYLYGTDVSIETLIANAYINKYKEANLPTTPISTSFFDVETSLHAHDKGSLYVATITAGTNVYTAILKRFFVTRDKQGNIIQCKLEDLQKLIDETFSTVTVNPDNKKDRTVASFNWKYNLQVFDTELEMLQWLFEMNNSHKSDFCSGWNIAYDMSVVESICEANEVPIENVLCPKELPKSLRSYRRRIDTNKNVPHFTRRWHAYYVPGYTYYYDAQQLYSRLRIADGFEVSYKLGYILDKNIKAGKIKFDNLLNLDPDTTDDREWHMRMSAEFPMHYIVYNQFDCMGLQIQEMFKTDATSMSLLADRSHLSNFNKQTRRAADVFHFSCLARNRVVASTPPNNYDNDDEDEDEMFSKVGGAVLPMDRTVDASEYVLSDRPNVVTYISRNVSDVDLKAIYPSFSQGSNVSRETRVLSIISLKSTNAIMTSQKLTELMTSMDSNAVLIANGALNLPNYVTADLMYKKYKSRRLIHT